MRNESAGAQAIAESNISNFDKAVSALQQKLLDAKLCLTQHHEEVVLPLLDHLELHIEDCTVDILKATVDASADFEASAVKADSNAKETMASADSFYDFSTDITGNYSAFESYMVAESKDRSAKTAESLAKMAAAKASSDHLIANVQALSKAMHVRKEARAARLAEMNRELLSAHADLDTDGAELQTLLSQDLQTRIAVGAAAAADFRTDITTLDEAIPERRQQRNAEHAQTMEALVEDAADRARAHSDCATFERQAVTLQAKDVSTKQSLLELDVRYERIAERQEIMLKVQAAAALVEQGHAEMDVGIEWCRE